MKHLKLAAAAALISVTIFSSCGGRRNPDDVRLKPMTTSIAGDLSEYIAVEDKEYEITGDYIGRLAVQVKALKPLNATYDQFELRASFFTKDGTPVSGIAVCNLDLDSRAKLANLLKRGSGVEILSFDANGWNAEIADRAKKFTVSSELTVSTNGHSTILNTTTSVDNGDIDAAIDEYERLTDDYVRMINGMTNEDPSEMMSGYADALVRSQEVGEKLEASKNELTSKQAARIIKIQAKLTTAMNKSEQLKG